MPGTLEWSGEGWQEEKIPDLRCALHYKAMEEQLSCPECTALSPARCSVPSPRTTSHCVGFQLTVTGGKATHEEKSVPFLVLSSEIEHGCKTLI